MATPLTSWTVHFQEQPTPCQYDPVAAAFTYTLASLILMSPLIHLRRRILVGTDVLRMLNLVLLFLHLVLWYSSGLPRDFAFEAKPPLARFPTDVIDFLQVVLKLLVATIGPFSLHSLCTYLILAVIEDAWVQEFISSMSSEGFSPDRKHVVIIGGGAAGMVPNLGTTAPWFPM